MATIIWMAHISADVTADGWTFATLFRAYGEWILPYVAGRLAIKTADDLKLLLPWVSGVVIALSLCAIVESLLGFNVVEMLFGDRPVAGFARNASRFGMKRAFVNTMHPIFYAIQLLILAPFCFGMIAKKSELDSQDARMGQLAFNRTWHQCDCIKRSDARVRHDACGFSIYHISIDSVAGRHRASDLGCGSQCCAFSDSQFSWRAGRRTQDDG